MNLLLVHMWHCMLGRGVVATVGNCAEMGEVPTSAIAMMSSAAAAENRECEDDQVAHLQISSPCGNMSTTRRRRRRANAGLDFQIQDFSFFNNCDEDVTVLDWQVRVPAKQSRSITGKRNSNLQRILWQYEGETGNYCVQEPLCRVKCKDFIELNQDWHGTGERTTNAITYSAYWGFSKPSKFSLTGGSCSDETARFLPDLEDLKDYYCGTPTTSNPYRCPYWETVDGIPQPNKCSTECAPSPKYGNCGDSSLCERTNPTAWQCGPAPGNTSTGFYKNWYLCTYWYWNSFAGPTGTSQTFPDGSFVNYWCGSNSCNGLDLISGVKLGGSCTQLGVAALTITTCPEP